MIKRKTMVVEEEEMETIMGECVKSSNVLRKRSKKIRRFQCGAKFNI